MPKLSLTNNIEKEKVSENVVSKAARHIFLAIEIKHTTRKWIRQSILEKLGLDGKIDIDAGQDASVPMIGFSMQSVDGLSAAKVGRVLDLYKDDLVGNVFQSRRLG